MTIMMVVLARLLFLPTLVVAAAFLVKAHAASGGGFSAGLTAGLAVVLRHLSLTEDEPTAGPGPFGRRSGALGLLPMLLVAFVPVALGHALLSHAEGLELGTLHLDTTFAFDAGIAFLVAAFLIVVMRLTDPFLDEGTR